MSKRKFKKGDVIHLRMPKAIYEGWVTEVKKTCWGVYYDWDGDGIHGEIVFDDNCMVLINVADMKNECMRKDLLEFRRKLDPKYCKVIDRIDGIRYTLEHHRIADPCDMQWLLDRIGDVAEERNTLAAKILKWEEDIYQQGYDDGLIDGGKRDKR